MKKKKCNEEDLINAAKQTCKALNSFLDGVMESNNMIACN